MAQYNATQSIEDSLPVVKLSERDSASEVAISPAFGCNAYDFHLQGKRLFWGPQASLAELVARPRLCGNPLLAPWANRIQGMSYFVNGKEYQLNSKLGNLRLDGNQNPIHGLVTFTKAWKTVNVQADAQQAQAHFVLDFWQHPEWLAQFPFPHRIHLHYVLRGASLEVRTEIENLGVAPMPVAIGFHPYFQISDAPRDEWRVKIRAKSQYRLSSQLTPTGELIPNPRPGEFALQGVVLDDVFGELQRGADGKAVFSVRGKTQEIRVVYGPDYPIGVVYAPAGQPFICFEPMAAPTNAFNLAHEGKYAGLKSIAPGASWRESYWIEGSGF